MYQRYKDRAGFLFVYIREAHPEDEWQLPSNVEQEVSFKQPANWFERQSVARACCKRLKLSMPVVVDTMDDQVDTAYAAWPERIYIVDGEGRIAYAGRRGPWGFKPAEAEAALKALLRQESAARVSVPGP